ncbi:motility associated factor glycosyltransferase family protein [Planctomicrobium piriforme]|uniref:Uncharacterized protein n=1 Tax=Planctomicrobium piriforme TaxID=1576369 RepID=A0A1I3C1G1_9PLAN|nr:hypothetical protein [Planctomicrobium piriforme]SFH68384.1 hypothetical protein SAMN05421753_10244 [Planctomicrobium piriforme]
MFFRRHTDGARVSVPLENQFAGPFATPCWIIGGGPSLSKLAIDEILNSPAPRFAMNLAGAGLLRPHFWTSYDPTVRFQQSIYLDPSITKFVHEGRAMDLVPETTFKVCECPALYLIDREKQRGFQDFPGTGPSPITDWQDSLIQAIDIAYRLGFRDLYLAGCEMHVAPSRSLRRAAAERGVRFQPRMLLGEFARRCEQAGSSRAEIEARATEPQYHFDETKSFAAAIQTDFHYFRVCQYLRLARRSMALAGLRLFSVTPGSRLNDHFPSMTVSAACRRMTTQAGDPSTEQTRGRYSNPEERRLEHVGPMRDFRPHFWPAPKNPPHSATKSAPMNENQRLQQALAEVPEVVIDLNEEG